MALNGLFCADVPLRNYSLTHAGCLLQLFTCTALPEWKYLQLTMKTLLRNSKRAREKQQKAQ